MFRSSALPRILQMCRLSTGAAPGCLLCEGFRAGDQEPLDSRLGSSGWGEREGTSLRLLCHLSSSLRLWQWGQRVPHQGALGMWLLLPPSYLEDSVAKGLLFVLQGRFCRSHGALPLACQLLRASLTNRHTRASSSDRN